MIVISSCSAML